MIFPKAEFLDLAGRGQRKGLDDPNESRHLETGQAFAAVGLDLGGVGGRAGAQAEGGGHLLACHNPGEPADG